ncbi:flavin monoamine oxidase family protein [Nocardiopsis sp. NPDC058631]|uniref:flavin monoamine oxidase family protein n=1 Tax=Nocardiopsis sp. NPDC058631 TaxID=3346566 RepID=UPI00365D6976
MEHSDVVIVGAGLSGLAAAWRLREAGARSVVVLEGRPAAGGRAAASGAPLPDGVPPASMYARRTDRDLLDLASALDVPVDELPDDPALSDLRIDEDGESEASDEHMPLDSSWWTLLRNEWILGRIARRCEGIDFAEPWRSANAEKLDALTVRGWLRSHTSDPELLELVEEQLTLAAALPADRISMLWLLAHLGPTPARGERPLRLDPDLLVRRLAAWAGDDLRTGHHVSRIEHGGERALLHGDWGSLSADHVVIAVPPSDADRLDMTPAPAPSRRRLQRQWPQTEVIRTEIVYWRPFWRGFGLSGELHFDDGIPAWTIDDSPSESSQGRLVAHTYTFGEADPLGADQSIADDPDRHRALLLDNLSGVLGPLAADPVSLHQTLPDSTPYSRAYQSPMPPGFLTEFGPLMRAPVGPLRWAATETAVFPCNGTLNGAVSSGYRAAEEVLAEVASHA